MLCWLNFRLCELKIIFPIEPIGWDNLLYGSAMVLGGQYVEKTIYFMPPPQFHPYIVEKVN